jgi:MoaA/NifB/PqqE/SkfB family radical SAM enzyme
VPAADWKEGLRSLLERVTPFHLDWIQVEVSSLCHGGCLYCPVNLCSRERKGALMSMETFRRLEPWFPSADLVFLQGWGEPLLHPRFWEMARRARSGGARVGFTTSGVLLDPANRRALLDTGLEVMGVSLAGASPEVHGRFRPACPLEAVDENVRALRDEGKASEDGLPNLHLAYLLMTGNLHDLPHAVDLAEQWGARQIVVSHLSLVLSPGLEEEALLAHPDLWPQVRAVLDETRERAEARGIGFHAYGPEGGGRPKPICTENVLASCFVSVRGDVSPCVMTNLGVGGEARAKPGPGPEEDAGSQPAPEVATGGQPTHWFMGEEFPLRPLVFGNVHGRSLKDIWHSSAARKFREIYRERLARNSRHAEGLPDPCRNCYKLFQS